VLLTWAVLLGLDLLLDLLGDFDSIGKGSYGLSSALASLAFTIPRRAYQLFPTAAVIGTLLGLGQLAAAGELTALRAVGISRRRMAMVVAIGLGLLTALMVTNGETLAPWGQQRADDLRSLAKGQGRVLAGRNGVWAREADVFLHADNVFERNDQGRRWLELRETTLYHFDNDGRLQSLDRARLATHHAGGWTLHAVQQFQFGPDRVVRTELPVLEWPSKLDATALAASVTQPRYLAMRELRKTMDYLQRNQLDDSAFAQIYWGRWFYPFNVLALCLAAMPFAFGSQRSGGQGKRLFIGIVFALGFWLLQEQFARLASVFRFDFRIAYALPPLAMLGLSWLLFRRRSG
jgi:lipopolysaccharide export system permease protein